MDPRLYTYEFRRPRLQNPTFKSDHLYESIYHMGAYGKIYPNLDKISNNVPTRQGFVINPNRPEGPKQVRPDKLHQEIMKIDPYYQNLKTERNRQQPEPSNNNIQRLPNLNYQSKPYGQMQPYSYSKHLNNETVQRQNNFSQSRSYSQDSKNIKPRQEDHEAGYISGYGSKILFSPTPRRGAQDSVFEKQQKPYNIINCYPKQVLNTHRAYPKYTLEHKLIENGQYPYIPINPERIYDNR